jgi:hypothetical protein
MVNNISRDYSAFKMLIVIYWLTWHNIPWVLKSSATLLFELQTSHVLDWLWQKLLRSCVNVYDSKLKLHLPCGIKTLACKIIVESGHIMKNNNYYECKIWNWVKESMASLCYSCIQPMTSWVGASVGDRFSIRHSLEHRTDHFYEASTYILFTLY